MNVIDSIQQRRAIKHYDPKYQMTQDEINQLMSLVKLAPTAFNQQNTRFVIVSDQTLRQQIRVAAHDQVQVTEASLLIVICADTKAWKKDPQRYWDNAPHDIQQHMNKAIDAYYRDKEQVQRDEAMRSAGIAAQTIMLAAKSMDYDSCPMDGFDFDKVADIINLPDDHTIAMMVVVGKAIQPARSRLTQLALNDVIIQNKF